MLITEVAMAVAKAADSAADAALLTTERAVGALSADLAAARAKSERDEQLSAQLQLRLDGAEGDRDAARAELAEVRDGSPAGPNAAPTEVSPHPHRDVPRGRCEPS